MRKTFYPIFLIFFLTTPFTLHSTDIYTSSLGEVKIHANLNPLIIPGDSKLGNTVLIVSTPIEKNDIHIITSCEHRESILYKEPRKGKILSVIQLSFPASCEDSSISLGDQEHIFTDTTLVLPMQTISQIENSFINTHSNILLSTMRGEILANSNTGTSITEKLSYLQTLYRNLGITIKGDIARDILQDRNTVKYISPVAGYVLPRKDKLIPGTGRPYRRDVTDGIHHGWDIMAPIGTPVQALSKGKIIRIINGWNWGRFGAFKRGKLTKDDELRNLDIYRGNQIWLQTMDGNVVFYSHLSRISPDIVVGSLVNMGTYLGNIGTSGVPEKNYKDVHLHFEIQQNPFDESMKNPSYLDIMRWRYMGEGLKRAQIYGKMGEVFE